MDSTQLRQKLSDLGLSTASKRLSLQTISGAMKTLASFNIIARGRGSFNDNNYSFFILPSIKYIISTSKMNALYKFLTGSEEQNEDSSSSMVRHMKALKTKTSLKKVSLLQTKMNLSVSRRIEI